MASLRGPRRPGPRNYRGIRKWKMTPLGRLRTRQLQSRSDLRGFASLMQRRSDCLFERDLSGEKLIRRLQITHPCGIVALQYQRKRHEINFTRLIGGQRDSKILLRQGNQRVAIENGALVRELRAAE